MVWENFFRIWETEPQKSPRTKAPLPITAVTTFPWPFPAHYLIRQPFPQLKSLNCERVLSNHVFKSGSLKLLLSICPTTQHKMSLFPFSLSIPSDMEWHHFFLFLFWGQAFSLSSLISFINDFQVPGHSGHFPLHRLQFISDPLKCKLQG